MGGLKSPRRVKGDGWDESRSGDYPTLKLSPSPAKERVNLEKTASPSNPTSVVIVKPERTKRPSPKLDGPSSQHGPDVNKEAVGKHQKFGVRVLPDPKALAARLKSTSEEVAAHSDASKKPHTDQSSQNTAHSTNNPNFIKTTMTETEHQENEQNSMVEQINTVPVVIKNNNVGSNVLTGQAGGSVEVVDSTKPHGRLLPKNLFYDERGIDVGPVEEEENRRKSASYESKNKDEDLIKRQNGDGAGATDNHNNVKLLLTKGLQNLKEKLHHHDKKKTSTTPEPQSDVEVNPNPSPSKKKPGKTEKLRKSSSSDSDGTPEKTEVKMRSNIHTKTIDKEDKDNEHKKDIITEGERQTYEGQIPTEIPEEVQRAAVAARSNRKSCSNLMPDVNVNIVSHVQDKSDTSTDAQLPQSESQAPSVYPSDGNDRKQRVHHQESLSEDSSGEHNDTDGGDRAPKKSNKRKAPPPPPEDEDTKTIQNTLVSGTKTDQVMSNDLESVGIDNDPHNRNTSTSTDGFTPKMENTSPIIVNSSEVQVMGINSNSGSYPSFTEMGRQQNNPPIQNQITNIIVESNSSVPETNTLKVEMSGSDDIDIDEVSPSSKATDANSESDSDVEQREVDASLNRNKKGGTTIELNSSHITIHHSPSVDTVTLELEADNTRKAASLGDLSRFDTDQPMSVLERAVSLDLADSGTPHSCKKRKAPLPPPGDDYVSNVQDNEDETLYRKEPRLDSALDTFQRRRLKKSSDWGTMEDAVQQASPPTSRKSSNMISDVNVVTPQSVELNNFDNKTKEEEMETNETEPIQEEATKNVVPLDSINIASFPKASARKFDSKGQPHTFTNTQINPDDDIHMQVNIHSVRNGLDSEANAESLTNVLEGHSPQRTVLRITPEPSSNVEQVSSSLVTFAPTSTTSGPSSLNAYELVESQVPDKDNDTNGGHSLTFIQGHKEETLFDNDSSYASTPIVSQSTEHHTIVSSTPLANRDHHTHYIDTVQSQQVTSTDGGVQNIQVVSSSTHTASSIPSDMLNISRIGRNLLGTGAFESSVSSKSNDSYESEPSVVVTSATDPYITAGSIVDSTTTYISNSDDEDSTMGQDSPPELPTSPVPVMASSYTPSSSMTYITEIQVSTITPSKAVTSHTITHNGTLETDPPMRKRESSISSDSIGSGGEDKDTDLSHETKSKEESAIPCSNVTVTSIGNTSPGNNEKSRIPTRLGMETILTTFQSSPNVGVFERSQIPMRSGTEGIMTTFQSSQSNVKNIDSSQIPVRVGSEGILTTFKSNVNVGSGDRSQIPTRMTTSTIQEGSTTVNNGPSFGDKKSKATRPPVPPRKSDTSVSSVVTVEVPSSTRSADNSHSKFMNNSTPYGIFDSTSSAQNNGGSKKFISFSSLTPRPVSGDGSGRNNSSFEQWVFLEGDNAHNGQDTSIEDGSHSGVVTLPSGLAGRPSSVTHILLDAKQSSGSRSTQ